MSPVTSWADRIKVASEATTGSFEELADGVYSFVVPEKAKVAEKDGWPRYSVFLKVESGPRANSRIWHNFYTTEKPNGMRMFFDQMAVLGLTLENFFSKNPTDDQIAQALVGRRFTAEVYEDDYNGKKSKKLRNFKPAIGSAPAVTPQGPAAGLSGPGAGFGAPPAVQAPVAPQVPAQGFAAPPADPWQQAAQAPVAPGADPWANAGLQAPPLV